MSNCYCTKCGAHAYSKCPRCRTVFPENQQLAVLSHVLTAEIGDYGKQGKCDDLLVSLTLLPDETGPSALARLLRYLHPLSEQDLIELFCQHDWQHKPGTGPCAFNNCRIPTEEINDARTS